MVACHRLKCIYVFICVSAVRTEDIVLGHYGTAHYLLPGHPILFFAVHHAVIHRLIILSILYNSTFLRGSASAIYHDSNLHIYIEKGYLEPAGVTIVMAVKEYLHVDYQVPSAGRNVESVRVSGTTNVS